MKPVRPILSAAALLSVWFARDGAARAQQIDLSHGGQVTVTAAGGFDWDQKAQKVTAYRSARAVRGNVTVDADTLIAYYRKKAAAPGAPPPAQRQPSTPGQGPDESGANEIYRLEAVGHVHIYTQTDQAWGDHAVYDIDKSVLVMTGHALRLTTPQDVLTARDSMEYYSQTRISIGRGNATVTTNDGRRIVADTLVGYSAPPDQAPQKGAPPAKSAPASASPAPAAGATPPGQDPLASSGKLKKVDAFGNVVVRTPTETVRGDKGVYVPDSGIARIVGHVHITRGQNQLNGSAAVVNMHTGLATMTEAPGTRVEGLIMPNDNSDGGATPGGKAGARVGTGK